MYDLAKATKDRPAEENTKQLCDTSLEKEETPKERENMCWLY